MKKIVIAGLMTVLFIIENMGVANATLIDFENHESFNIHAKPLPAKSNKSVVVTDYYADRGVVFGRPGLSAGAAVVKSGESSSPRNGVSGLDAFGNFVSSFTGDIYFHFVDPANSSLMATTDATSFYIGDSGGDTDAWYVHVYDISNNLLETKAVSSVANVQVSFAYNNMHRFWIQWTGGSYGYLLDDLNFNSPTSFPVPEPATMLLFGTGLAGLLGFYGRKRR